MSNKEDIYKLDDEDDYEINIEENNSNDSNNSNNSKNNSSDELKRKLIKYGIYIFVGLIVLLLLVALFFPKGSKKSSVETSEKELTLTSGEKYTLSYKKGTYTWTSSNQNVAKVSNNGEIEALKTGDTIISVNTGNEIINYKIHVNKVEESVVITNVKMEKNTIELEKNKAYNMKVTLSPSNATNKELTWFSSDENVAIVKDGVITAVSSGTCMITVKTTNGNIDTCLVKVLGDGNYNPVESISIDSEDVSLNKGTSYALSYQIVPSDSINLIEWESSDENIATVENGVVYALNSGEVEVTAKSKDIKKSIIVNVIEEVETPKFMLNQIEINLVAGDNYTLIPSNNNYEISWVSSNINVAEVDSNGYVVAKSAGTSIITAKLSNGYYVDCIVNVSEKPEEVKKEEKPEEVRERITLNTSSVNMNTGDSIVLSETVSPTNNVSSVVWSSSNNSVATVEKGKVTAIGTGTATITAKLPNGEYAECIVNVSERFVGVSQVVINVKKITLTKNKSFQLTAKVLPTNATNKDIKWYSSNTSVAVVDSNGKVTAKGVGSAKIYAKSSNGIIDDCGVVVN